MKKLWLVAVAVVLSSVFLTNCSLADGKAYLTVQMASPTYDTLTAGFAQGAGLPNNWYTDTRYQVNPGTWTYNYNVTEVFWDGSYYRYYVDAYSILSYYYSASDSYQSSYAGVLAYSNYVYNQDTISITTNPGFLILAGADRDYTLTFEFGYSPYISQRGVALSAKVLADDATKIVTAYTSPYDTITITHSKVKTTAKSLAPMNRNAPSTVPVKVKP